MEKKTLPSFPESVPEQVQSHKIIVIHPGSLFLRIGRASDLNPHRILHAIARRRKPGGTSLRDNFLPRCTNKTKELLQDLEDCRLQVSHTLQSCIQSDGRRRYATPPQQIAAFNRRSKPEIESEISDVFYYEPREDIVVGDQVIELDPDGEFNIHCPIKRGELNLHGGIGGSLTSVLVDLETIWTHVLKKNVGIDKKDLQYYKAVLVIPDIHQKTHLKELTTLLLNRIGFGTCFLVQDHVAATFGAGLGYACVVDVGDQKTSISCVEDGISHPTTRIRLQYGGADVTQTLFWLLSKCAFPYQSCDDSIPADAFLLKRLKEEYCHVDLDICGSREKVFFVRQPNKPVLKYVIQVGDECLVAPLSMFNTELLGISGPKCTRTQTSNSQVDPEDCFDGEYLRETGRKGTKDTADQTIVDYMTGEGGVTNGDDDIVVDCGLEGERDIRSNDKEFVVAPGQVLGLDQAILQSIDRCSNDELKRKMYACILIVGGGMKFAGMGTWLHNRLSLQIPYLYRTEQMDMITRPKDMDPEITSWKGAAVMSCLESAPELWISKADWATQGLRGLRERAPFMC